MFLVLYGFYGLFKNLFCLNFFIFIFVMGFYSWEDVVMEVEFDESVVVFSNN